jgi:TPR repeat protein
MTQQSGRILLGALVAMLVVVGTAIAGPLEDAEVAYNSSDYTTAMRLYRSLADEGNAEAQVAIAIMYGRGEGVPQNYAEAAKWYRKAADQGNFMAQADLGILYEEGRGVPQNYVQAHKWFSLA